MIDETDIKQERQWYNQERANTVIKNLQKKHVNGFYAANRKEALNLVMAMIPPDVLVVRGDSMSVEQVGIIDELIKRNQNRLVDIFHVNPDGTRFSKMEDRDRLDCQAFVADIYIAGSNAITLDGKIVNVDGMGNRVAPMIYGPRKVILIVGINKIVSNEEEARQRIRDIAAPLNAKRHVIKHHMEKLANLTCVKTGRCVDCASDACICRYTVVINGTDAIHTGRINVVLVGEELGI